MQVDQLESLSSRLLSELLPRSELIRSSIPRFRCLSLERPGPNEALDVHCRKTTALVGLPSAFTKFRGANRKNALALARASKTWPKLASTSIITMFAESRILWVSVGELFAEAG